MKPSFSGGRPVRLALVTQLHYSSPREAVKVVTLAYVLGTVSGLRFVAPDLEPSVTVATALAMHVTYAVICRVFAAQHGRSGTRWGAAGLIGGVVTLAALLGVIGRQGS
jgi:hypothetical protein